MRPSASWIVHRLRAWRDARSGVAAVEFAAIAPVLAMMVAATAELGLAVRQNLQVQDAAAAGALYAAQYGWNQAGIVAAAAAAKSGSGVSATAALFCGCPSAAGVSATVCTAVCSDAQPARQYVTVNASVARQSVAPAMLPLPSTLAAQATTRLP